MAILWHELWHEGLEEASRLYFGERDVASMLSTLEPLHALLERGPQTLKEISFNQVFIVLFIQCIPVNWDKLRLNYFGIIKQRLQFVELHINNLNMCYE